MFHIDNRESTTSMMVSAKDYKLLHASVQAQGLPQTPGPLDLKRTSSNREFIERRLNNQPTTDLNLPDHST